MLLPGHLSNEMLRFLRLFQLLKCRLLEHLWSSSGTWKFSPTQMAISVAQRKKQEPPPTMDNGQPAEFGSATGSAGPAIKIAARTRVLMEAKILRYLSPFHPVFTQNSRGGRAKIRILSSRYTLHSEKSRVFKIYLRKVVFLIVSLCFSFQKKSYFKIYIFSSVLSCVWVEQQSKNKQKLQPGEINKKKCNKKTTKKFNGEREN